MNGNSKPAKRNEEGKKQYSRIVCTKVDEVPGKRRRRRGKWSCKLPKQQNMWSMWSSFIMRDYLQVLIGWLPENLDHSTTFWRTNKHYKISCTPPPHHFSGRLFWLQFGAYLSSLCLLTSLTIPTAFSPIAIGSKLVSTCIGFLKITLNASGFPVFLPNKKHLHVQPLVDPHTISAQGMKPGPTMEAVSNSWKAMSTLSFFSFQAVCLPKITPCTNRVHGNR